MEKNKKGATAAAVTALTVADITRIDIFFLLLSQKNIHCFFATLSNYSSIERGGELLSLSLPLSLSVLFTVWLVTHSFGLGLIYIDLFLMYLLHLFLIKFLWKWQSELSSVINVVVLDCWQREKKWATASLSYSLSENNGWEVHLHRHRRQWQ